MKTHVLQSDPPTPPCTQVGGSDHGLGPQRLPTASYVRPHPPPPSLMAASSQLRPVGAVRPTPRRSQEITGDEGDQDDGGLPGRGLQSLLLRCEQWPRQAAQPDQGVARSALRALPGMLSHARKHHFINADTPCHSVRVSRASQQHTLHTRGYSSLWISGPRADGTLHGKQMPSKRPSGAVAPQALAGPAGPHGAGADRWALRVAPPGHGWSRALPSSVLPSTRRCCVTHWGHTGLRGRWAAARTQGDVATTGGRTAVGTCG